VVGQLEGLTTEKYKLTRRTPPLVLKGCGFDLYFASDCFRYSTASIGANPASLILQEKNCSTPRAPRAGEFLPRL
jgi:hypothetical protein